MSRSKRAAMRSVNDAIFHSTAAVASLLNAESVWFERGIVSDAASQRRITENGSIDGVALRGSAGGFELGSEPVTIEVVAGGTGVGRRIDVAAQVQSNDVGALAREREGVRAALASGQPGDEGHLAVELSHVCPPMACGYPAPDARIAWQH